MHVPGSVAAEDFTSASDAGVAIIFIVRMVSTRISWILFDADGDGGSPVVTLAGVQGGVGVFWFSLLLRVAVVDERVQAVVEVLSVGECEVFNFLKPYRARWLAVFGSWRPFWPERKS